MDDSCMPCNAHMLVCRSCFLFPAVPRVRIISISSHYRVGRRSFKGVWSFTCLEEVSGCLSSMRRYCICALQYLIHCWAFAKGAKILLKNTVKELRSSLMVFSLILSHHCGFHLFSLCEVWFRTVRVCDCNLCRGTVWTLDFVEVLLYLEVQCNVNLTDPCIAQVA